MEIKTYLQLSSKRESLRLAYADQLKGGIDKVLSKYVDPFQSQINSIISDPTKSGFSFSAIVSDFADDVVKVVDTSQAAAVEKFATLFEDIRGSVDVMYKVEDISLPGAYVDENGILREITSTIDKYRTGKISEKRMTRILSSRLRKPAYIVNTLSNTHLAGMDNEASRSIGTMAGLDHYLYFGPISENSREFCKVRVGQIFTAAEIENMDNGQGLIVFRYCGGYNCMHELIPVNPEWKELEEYVK